MRAKELRPGDVFCVDPPDPESLIRVCLTNDEEHGLRFGWPGKSTVRFEGDPVPLPYHSGYWCYMGELCEVTLVRRPS